MMVNLVILAAVAAAIYLRSRKTKVDHKNVNDEWTGGVAPAEGDPDPRPSERQGKRQCRGST